MESSKVEQGEDSGSRFLPVEVWERVLLYLSPQDICLSFAPVCREFHAVHDLPFVWASILRRYTTGGGGDTEEGEAVQPDVCVWEDVWLINASTTVGSAQRQSLSVDWKREYISRVWCKVLILTYCSTKTDRSYEIDLYRQLKGQSIRNLDICRADLHGRIPDEKESEGICFVPLAPGVAKGYDTIIILQAMPPTEKASNLMGDVIYEHLQSGGGVVLCCYSYLRENRLKGKLHHIPFYPIELSISFSAPSSEENCTVLGDNDRHHPIMSRIYNVVIDRSRDTARCKTRLQPGAQVVAAYADAEPLAVVYNPGTEVDDPLKEGEERWGKIVFINFFPLTTRFNGGWYPPAPASDNSRLLANTILYVARKDPLLLDQLLK